MAINKNTNGSVWRKWDLHIHTPGTAKNDDYGNSKEVWEEYISRLESLVDICAFGITDYFSMENYLRLKREQDEKGRLKGKLLIPNIELRIIPVTKAERPINMHVLFDPSLEYSDIEREFFQKMIFQYKGNTYSCIKSNLISLGRAYAAGSSLGEEEAIKKAISQFVVSYNDLQKILTSETLVGRCLVGVSNSSQDGNSGIQEGTLQTTRCEIYRMADFIFTGNLNDCKYFLGEGTDTKAQIVEKYNGLKPCVTGSDAHKFSQIGVFPLNRNTWIKADTTWDGLRQIIFEPKDRVRIQEQKPEEKEPYQVISSVELDHMDTGHQIIPLNPNLNTIIGGRSSGKSLLLAIIAKLAGYKEKFKDNDEYNNYVCDLAGDAQLKWQDGISESRDIDFYGQSQISSMAKKKDEINQLVQRILSKNAGKREMIDEYDRNLTKIKTAISENIAKYFSYKGLIEKIEIEIKNRGSKTGISENINTLKNEMEKIKGESDGQFSEQDNIKYSNAKAQIEELQNQINRVSDKISNLNYIRDFHLINPIENELLGFDEEIKSMVNSTYEKIVEDAQHKWNVFLDDMIAGANTDLGNLKTKKDECLKSEEFLKGEEYYKKNENYKALSIRLENEKKALTEIESREKKLAEINQYLKQAKENILNGSCEYFRSGNELVKSLNLKRGELEIKTKVIPKFIRLENIVAGSFNLRDGEGRCYDQTYKFTSIEEYKTYMQGIFDKLVQGKIVLKSGKDINNVVVELFTNNYFDLQYDIIYGTDNLDLMSEGKAAFIILKLLLDFDDKRCPILIDQPEDDLDNRAIYWQLVRYLREKKIQRQIILVTHNPNVVVAADAEEVIVANQDGTATKNQDNIKFEYLSGSLENHYEDHTASTILLEKGIREHVCEILEGGKEAFKKREAKYGYI